MKVNFSQPLAFTSSKEKKKELFPCQTELMTSTAIGTTTGALTAAYDGFRQNELLSQIKTNKPIERIESYGKELVDKLMQAKKLDFPSVLKKGAVVGAAVGVIAFGFLMSINGLFATIQASKDIKVNK